MKKTSLNKVLFVIAFITSITLNAQIRGNGNITKQIHEVSKFNSVQINGAASLVITQGSNFAVEVETDSNIQEYITVEVRQNTLHFGFNNKHIKQYKILKFYVTAPNFKQIKASGASNITTKDSITGDHLQLTISGASSVNLNVDYNSITTKLSGAADVTLGGTATSSLVYSSGASEFHGKNLVTVSSVVNASGASTCRVNAKSNLTYEVSGAATVNHVSTPTTVTINKDDGVNKIIINEDANQDKEHYYNADTTSVRIGSLAVKVVDGDTTQITVGSHTLVVTDDGNVSWQHCKKSEFNGHWGGFELGINSYVTPDFNTSWGSEYDYLNLKYEKSIAVNLNVYEQNISLNKSKTIGLITGLGLSWNNYRFNNTTMLSTDSSVIKGYYMKNVSVRKTKLTTMYLTVPLIFEVQTNNIKKSNRFHFGVGVVAKVRISTHTKIYFNEADKEYSLEDPKTGETLPITYRTPNASSRNIVKNFGSYYLQPIKLDATVRFGYGIINLFATYSINTMFQSGRGPELYPITVGITLVGW